jgi:hypothetical protein
VVKAEPDFSVTVECVVPRPGFKTRHVVAELCGSHFLPTSGECVVHRVGVITEIVVSIPFTVVEYVRESLEESGCCICVSRLKKQLQRLLLVIVRQSKRIR